MHFKFIFFIFLSSILQVFAQDNSRKIIKRVQLENLENNNEVMYYKGVPYTGHCVDLNEKKVKRQEMTWENGLLQGPKIEYFEDGVSIRATLNFEQGKRHGVFFYNHPNGKVKLKGQYFYDELDSTIESFYITGKPKYTYHYNKGVKNGWSITYFTNGNIEQKVMIVNDKPSGFMKNYYEAGNIRLEAFYTSGIRNGMYYRYHLTGLLAEESYYKNGFQDSVCKYYDNVFGRLMKEEYYTNGKKNGIQLTFNELGDTTAIINFKDDVMHGEYKRFFNGNVTMYKKGFLKSKAKRRYKGYVSGLDEIGTYNNGKKHGKFVTGLTNKEYHTEGFYDNGVMVGEWKYFNANGKVVLHEKYDESGEMYYQKPKIDNKEEAEDE